MLGASGIAGVAGADSFLQPEMIATTANSAITDRSFFIRCRAWVNPPRITRLFPQTIIKRAHLETAPERGCVEDQPRSGSSRRQVSVKMRLGLHENDV